MVNTIKCLHLTICILIICDVTIIPCFGQRNSNSNKNKFKGTGGKFIPGKTKLGNKPYYPPRARRPTLGDVLRRQTQGNQPRRRPTTGQGNPSSQNIDHSDPNAVNYRNYLNNLKNNNNPVSGQQTAGDQSVHYSNVGKIIPPLRRSEGEKPPFAPSWTHCVITIQVSIAWVVVKSPHYPNKFQGQVQCSWIATAMEGYRVRVSFKDLDLLPPNSNGCGNQFVEVIDSTLEKSQARFCGSKIPGDYVSEGNKVRLDLIADAIGTPYRGFMAAFKADKEIPGRRETSYFAHGIPNMLYNPLTQSPPSNPVMPRGPPVAKRPVLRKKAPVPSIPGQKIYGPKNQPRDQVKEDSPGTDSLNSSTAHLYIIIAVILVILFAAAAAYVFKRFFYQQFKAWRKQQSQGKDSKESNEMENMNEIYGGRQKTLPGNMPLPPPPDMGRRQSVSFMDGHYSGKVVGADDTMFHHQNIMSPNNGSFGNLHRSSSLNDLSKGNWQQENSEPIYEDDDAMSLHSVASIRSSNRHPDHEMFKRQKILERQNSLRMSRNSFTGSMGDLSHQNEIYNSLNPYQANSLYSEQLPPMYNYDYMGGSYGSLPPTSGPNSHGMYGMYPTPSPHFPPTSQPMYTSSMSNLASGPVSNLPAQRYNHRSASMYDLTSINKPPDMTAQWSDQLNERIPSVASTTTSSTNPILKKTTPTPQSELAFTALRAAKSMNDLTAINTKLNECVSWTLPSQRRKSVVG